MKPTLNSVQQKELCDAVTSGATLEIAAAMVGCTEDIIRNTTEVDLEFRRRLEVAECEMTTRYLENLQKAVRERGDWRAAARWLEYVEANRDPKEDFIFALEKLANQFKPRFDKATRKKIGRLVWRVICELTSDDVQRPWKSFIPKQP